MVLFTSRNFGSGKYFLLRFGGVREFCNLIKENFGIQKYAICWYLNYYVLPENLMLKITTYCGTTTWTFDAALFLLLFSQLSNSLFPLICCNNFPFVLLLVSFFNFYYMDWCSVLTVVYVLLTSSVWLWTLNSCITRLLDFTTVMVRLDYHCWNRKKERV